MTSWSCSVISNSCATVDVKWEDLGIACMWLAIFHRYAAPAPGDDWYTCLIELQI